MSYSGPSRPGQHTPLHVQHPQHSQHHPHPQAQQHHPQTQQHHLPPQQQHQQHHQHQQHQQQHTQPPQQHYMYYGHGQPTQGAVQQGHPPQQQLPPLSNIPPLAQAHVCICPNVTRVPRPRNAFILYRQHHHSIVVAENPGKSNPEISKIIGEQWRNLDQQEKNFWVQLSDEEKRSHLERFPDYRYQPRRNAKKNGSDSTNGVCNVCKGITSAGAGQSSAYPKSNSGGSVSSVGSIGSISMAGSRSGSTTGSFSSMSSPHGPSFEATYPPPPPPPPPQGALFHHYPGTRYSYPSSMEPSVNSQARHNSAPEPLPRIVPRPQDEFTPNDTNGTTTPTHKHLPLKAESPIQYPQAFPPALPGPPRRLPLTHALIEEDHSAKRRRTSSFYDPLAAPHQSPQSQRRSLRYRSAIAIASGQSSPRMTEDIEPMTMKEKVDALNILCDPLPGQERSRIVAIEGGGEFGVRVAEAVRLRLASTTDNNSFVALHNVAGSQESAPNDSLACIINQKPGFITDGFASAMWSITCLHQLVSNYFRSAPAGKSGIVLLNGYLVSVADKFAQEHLMRQASISAKAKEEPDTAASSPRLHQLYVEEWMSSANLLRGLPFPDVLIYLQPDGADLEVSVVELKTQSKLVVVRGGDGIFDKVVEKIISVIQ